MKPVLLLFLLACSAVLACVALPPPLPPANDPANDKAAEAPYSPPAQLPAGSSAGADAGPPAGPHHHRTRPGAAGGTPCRTPDGFGPAWAARRALRCRR